MHLIADGAEMSGGHADSIGCDGEALAETCQDTGKTPCMHVRFAINFVPTFKTIWKNSMVTREWY